MSNEHLDNTIDLLERGAKVATNNAIKECERALTMLNGDMAQMSVESEINRLEEYGIEPDEITPLYTNLTLERDRRILNRHSLTSKEEIKNAPTRNNSMYSTHKKNYDKEET